MNNPTPAELLAKPEVMKEVYLNDSHDSEYGTTTYWFTAPKELVTSYAPDADEAEISVELPTNEQTAENAYVGLSSVYDCTCEDWDELQLAEELINKLLEKAKKGVRG